MQTFEELSDIFSDHNNYLTSRELLMRVSVGCCICLKCNLTMLPANAFKKTCVPLETFYSKTTNLIFFFIFPTQEGTSKFASLESCAKEHQKRTHKRLQLQKEMVRLKRSLSDI